MPPKRKRTKPADDEEELDGKTCFEKIRGFQTIAEFLEEIPEEDYSRYVTKAIKSQRSNKIKCIECDKTFASSSGFLQHIRKCQELKVEENQEEEEEEKDEWDGSTYVQFKLVPTIWLKVDEQRKKDVINMISKGNYRCFGDNCSQVFRNADLLIKHLNSCVQPSYASFMDNLEGIRNLDAKMRSKIVREALQTSADGRIKCVGCDKTFKNIGGLTYHLDRCNLDEMWICEKCHYKGKLFQKNDHAEKCQLNVILPEETKAGRRSRNMIMKIDPDFVMTSGASEESEMEEEVGDAHGSEDEDENEGTNRKQAVRGGNKRRVIRDGDKEDQGCVKYRFRKSEIFKANNSGAYARIQMNYESSCRKKFEEYQNRIIEPCPRIQQIEIPNWTTIEKDETYPLHQNLDRKSVTIKNVEFEVPKRNEKIIVGYCGVPINSIKIAPNQLESEEDLICVCTFPNEMDFEGDSSLVQFWKYSQNSQLSPYFLLSLPKRGVVLSMEWLLSRNDSNYAAFSMSNGEILIYNINVDAVIDDSDPVPILESEAGLILQQPDSQKVRDVMPPITRISWLWQNGGEILAAINAAGNLIIWNLEEDLKNPKVFRDPTWASPATDVAFLNENLLVVGFRERLIRVFKLDNMSQAYLHDNSAKMAGQKVLADARVFDSFFSYQAEYNSTEKSYGTGIGYFSIDHGANPSFTVVPLFNLHQLMTSQVAIQPTRGIVVSCGIDGRLCASANGKITNANQSLTPYSASRDLLLLTRRKVEKEKEETDEKKVEPTCFEHENVCENMWIEMEFDQKELHKAPQLSCRDQRIESLNVVETNNDFERPTVFCGGEAGLLFVVPCSLKIK
ncbi:unnamed protein product [Caenorhabditis angaria]|uniref:C2H2-type domain-containing protein n=1 Tax=Caenorhabditis angaria TaxID=860376 RepID=A0A9P1I3P8_9PELO|nr:unnamed protein product [Caenorhabditis angaria]